MNLDFLDTIRGAEIFTFLLSSLKDMCEKYEGCVDCPFRTADKECLLDCEPEDYNIELITQAIYKQIRKEQVEDIARSLRRGEDNGNR